MHDKCCDERFVFGRVDSGVDKQIAFWGMDLVKEMCTVDLQHGNLPRKQVQRPAS